MAKNVGGIDRVIRAVVAVGIFAWVGLNNEMGYAEMMILSAVGLVLLLTAIFGFCPAYLPFGIKTCKTK